jgi:hypothetical protein
MQRRNLTESQRNQLDQELVDVFVGLKEHEGRAEWNPEPWQYAYQKLSVLLS